MSQKKSDHDKFVRRYTDERLIDREVESRRLTQIEGLRFIAERLNEVLAGRLPEGRELGEQLVRLSREKSGKGSTWKDHSLSCWGIMEGIVEAMTDQPSREKPLPSPRTLLTGESWNPNKRIPHPKFSIAAFNQLAQENPLSLRVLRKESRGRVEVYSEHYPTNEMEEALWYLWRFFFHDGGWERLKRCPQCMRWFVDDTRNKQKQRCSSQCTWQWWSRDRRKESGHRVPKGKKRRREV